MSNRISKHNYIRYKDLLKFKIKFLFYLNFPKINFFENIYLLITQLSINIKI
jgi:hypothetical protein